MMSDSNSFAFYGSCPPPPPPANENIFPPINLHHKMMSDSRFSHHHHHMQHHNFLPAEILDPTNYIDISNWVASQKTTNPSNSSQYYGQINRAPAANVTVAVAAAAAEDDQISTSGVQILNQLNGLKYDQEAKVVAGESLDCLLSSTDYTNTDNSIEDDGISSLFSDGSDLWPAVHQSAHQVNAISSGKSACNGLQTSQHGIGTQLCFPQAGMHDIYRTGGLKTVTSCKKDSGMSHHVDIPDIRDMSNAPKKRNFDETLFKHNQSYHFLDHTHNYHKSDSSEIPQEHKKPKPEKCPIINFQQPNNNTISTCSNIGSEEDLEAIAQMKDIIYGAAAFRPVNIGVAEEVMEKPKRKNVRISNDPQTVAARQRRERISERIRVLQKLVPGGSKMDTASMLDEAANYLKFLRTKVKELEGLGQWCDFGGTNSCYATNFAYPSSIPFLNPMSMQSYFSLHNPNYSFK